MRARLLPLGKLVSQECVAPEVARDVEVLSAVLVVVRERGCQSPTWIGDAGCLPLLQELASLDCEIDRVALAAFDIYATCREQLYQVRIKELKSGSYILTDTPCASALLRERKKGPVKIN